MIVELCGGGPLDGVMLEVPDSQREWLVPITTWTMAENEPNAVIMPKQVYAYRAPRHQRPHLSVVARWTYHGIEQR